MNERYGDPAPLSSEGGGTLGGSVGGVTAGSLLSAGRRAAGLNIAEVSAKLKLSQRQIEALEADRYADLPGNTFAKGFARNYARLLGIDPQAILDYMDRHLPSETPQSALPRLSDEALPLKRPGGRVAVSVAGRLIVVLAVLAALLAAGFYAYQWAMAEPGLLASTEPGPVVDVVPPVQSMPPEPPLPLPPEPPVLPTAAAALPQPVVPAPQPASVPPPPAAVSSLPPALPVGSAKPVEAPPVDANVPIAAPKPASAVLSPSAPQSASLPVATAAKPAPALAPVPAPVPPVPVIPAPSLAVPPPVSKPISDTRPVVAPAIASPAPAPAPLPKETTDTGELRLVAKQESWISVTDASGKRLVNALFKPGEVRSVAGQPPYKLRIGNAQQVELVYKGRPTDLKPHTKVDVADLTLN